MGVNMEIKFPKEYRITNNSCDNCLHRIYINDNLYYCEKTPYYLSKDFVCVFHQRFKPKDLHL